MLNYATTPTNDASHASAKTWNASLDTELNSNGLGCSYSFSDGHHAKAFEVFRARAGAPDAGGDADGGGGGGGGGGRRLRRHLHRRHQR